MKRRLLVVAALLAALVSPLFASVALAATSGAAGTNDYPYRNDQASRQDRWGFTSRQCVSFAAWRLTQHGDTIHNDNNAWGNASNWDDEARKLHMTVSSRAKIGSIAQWNADESSAYYPTSGGHGTISAGGYGHVAYVEAVYRDGSVKIEQYNMNGQRTYSVMHVKAPRYLYIT